MKNYFRHNEKATPEDWFNSLSKEEKKKILRTGNIPSEDKTGTPSFFTEMPIILSHQIGLNLKYRNAPVMEHQDQKYIDALINNDSTLQQEIYNKFSADIKCLVLQNNGSEADAGDLFQEGLVFIYKKAKSGKFTLTCPFGAFLYAVCRNKWLNELTKRKHAQVTLKEIQKYNNVNEDSFHSSDEIYLQQARKDLLLAKLSEMDEVCKKILFLSWNGKTMKQVARLLNLSYGYARKKKCECMAELVIAIEQSTEYNSLKW